MKHSFIPCGRLESIPPLYTDMPLDCMIGYIVMDSLSRSASINDVMNKPLTTSIDSLRVAARYMYAVCDYSPRLFRKYIHTTRDLIPGENCMSFPANSYYGLEIAIERRLDDFGKDYAMLLRTHCIYRVVIDTVVTGIDTTYTNPLSWVNVCCTVQDKIKGQIIPINCHYIEIEEYPEITTFNENCLGFGYPENWVTGEGFNNEKGANTGTYIRTVQAGEEYYVFLEQLSLWKFADFLTTTHEFEASGGLFRINAGYVEDPSNFWGLGTNPKEQDFIDKLNELIGNINTWWVQ